MEDKIENFLCRYYRDIEFENEKIMCIQKEYDFGNNGNYKGATVDFLGRTNNRKYLLIECKYIATEESIGQVLKYIVYTKEKFRIEDKDILTVLLANRFHNDFFVGYSLIEHLNLFKPYQWEMYYSFRKDKKFYHIFSVPNRKNYQIIKEVIKNHQCIREGAIEAIKDERWELITSGDPFIVPTEEEIQKLVEGVFGEG